LGAQSLVAGMPECVLHVVWVDKFKTGNRSYFETVQDDTSPSQIANFRFLPRLCTPPHVNCCGSCSRAGTPQARTEVLLAT